ncbi:hypothetical protein GVX82_02650 [Patescibacteria group bacterium]|jgi:hypothetical protein|nr:hypothetical protein [Patescibacteria group bacterium]
MTDYGPFVLFELIHQGGLGLAFGAAFLLLVYLLGGARAEAAPRTTRTIAWSAALGALLIAIGEAGLYWFLWGPGSQAVMTYTPQTVYLRWVVALVGAVAVLSVATALVRGRVGEIVASLSLASFFMVLLINALGSALPTLTTWLVWWAVFSTLLAVSVVVIRQLEGASSAEPAPVQTPGTPGDEPEAKST